MRPLPLVFLVAVSCSQSPGAGDAGPSPAPDAGMDAGADAGGTDAGPLDAGEDAGPADAGGWDAGTLLNPVYPGDLPDPFVLRVGNTFHAYGTNAVVGGVTLHIPHLSADALGSWSLVGDALPAVGSWANGAGLMTWAPSVLRVSDSFFVLYYAAQRKGTGQQCLGRAASTSPAGPFVDSWSAPLFCNLTAPQAFWSLDPSPFADDDGSLYLVWRQDDGSAGGTNVAVQPLDPTGLSFVTGTTPTLVLSRAPGSWEDPVIENPAMRKVDGAYYLFYSANRWDTGSYAIGYATCAAPAGPCTKQTSSGPWLAASGLRQGPGGEDFFTDPTGALWMSLHAWTAPNVGYADGGARALWVYRFGVDGGVPYVEEP